MIAFCTPLLMRVIQLAKSQNITSIADFIAARYGKSQAVAATAAAIAIIGSVPYIALQLKAVASSLETILNQDQDVSSIPYIGDIAFLVTITLAAFAVLFGTRQTDATEHQHGLMLAVATESLVKLIAFIAAGVFVTFVMFGPADLWERAMKTPEAVRAIQASPSVGNFLAMTLLSVSSDHAAATAVSCQRGRELDRGRGAPRALAVPALSDRDQRVRDSHRHCRPCHLSIRRNRQRYVCAGIADLGGRDGAQRDRVHRRPVRRHRDGDRGMRRLSHHGVE